MVILYHLSEVRAMIVAPGLDPGAIHTELGEARQERFVETCNIPPLLPFPACRKG
jgi:hypothetical protein